MASENVPARMPRREAGPGPGLPARDACFTPRRVGVDLAPAVLGPARDVIAGRAVRMVETPIRAVPGASPCPVSMTAPPAAQSGAFTGMPIAVHPHERTPAVIGEVGLLTSRCAGRAFRSRSDRRRRADGSNAARAAGHERPSNSPDRRVGSSHELAGPRLPAFGSRVRLCEGSLRGAE